MEPQVDHGLDATTGPLGRDLARQPEPCRRPRRTHDDPVSNGWRWPRSGPASMVSGRRSTWTSGRTRSHSSRWMRFSTRSRSLCTQRPYFSRGSDRGGPDAPSVGKVIANTANSPRRWRPSSDSGTRRVTHPFVRRVRHGPVVRVAGAATKSQRRRRNPSRRRRRDRYASSPTRRRANERGPGDPEWRRVRPGSHGQRRGTGVPPPLRRAVATTSIRPADSSTFRW